MPKPPTAEDLIGSAAACQILGGINRSTLSRWIATGRIKPTIQLPGPNGAFLFQRTAVEDLARQRAA